MWCNTLPLGTRFRVIHTIQGGNAMSRVSTPPTPTTNSTKVPHEKIAMRAYEKWCKRGRPHGNDKQDWNEAEAELRMELARTGNAHATSR